MFHTITDVSVKVSKIIANLKDRKVPGHDCLTTRMLKELPKNAVVMTNLSD